MIGNRCICAFAFSLVLMLGFSACERETMEPEVDNQVRLTASLSPVLSSVYTKGEGEIRSDHSQPLKISLAKVVGNDGDFSQAENTQAMGAVMGTPDGMGIREILFDDFQGFPNATDKVHYVGWYPDEESRYSNPATGPTTVSVTIPDDASTDILYSDVASGTRLSGFNTMTFRHALVKYSIWAYAMESEQLDGTIDDVWGKINKVELLDMPSECTLTLPESSQQQMSSAFSGEKDLVGTVSLDEIPVGFSDAAQLKYFLAPPPRTNILKIKITTDKEVKNQNLSISRDFQPGKHYKIYLRFTTHGIINADVVVEKWQDGGDDLNVETNTGVYYNLSESQTANTYIISSAYNYCFDATVRGNGYTGVAGIPNAPADAFKVGDAVDAEIVWTDMVASATENLDNIFKLTPKVIDGKVYFSVVPSEQGGSSLKKEGNVLIGVRDAAGNLLWTWHIWLTDRPQEQGYKNGFTVLDRDMGATAYKPSEAGGTIAGVYYQWGRPTPLPLGKNVYKPEYKEDGSWKSNVVVTFAEESASLAVVERVKQPLMYFTSKVTSSEGTLTKHLWGWRSETDEYAKTICDPCPPGYRMPSIKLWRDLKIHDVQVVDNEVDAIEFKVDANSADVFYPLTGYYTDKDALKEYDSGAYMWAATFDVGTPNNASDDQPYALDFTSDGLQMETKTEFSNYALPVRCISRMSKAHVTDLSDYQTANSYMIHKTGYYKFKATVRGNGVGQLVSPGSTSTIVLTEQLGSVDIKSRLVKVEPLWWHSYVASEAPSADNFTILNEGKPDADGYVSFKVDSFMEGNLILAGYDAKGEIIWSWHLWFTDEPQMMKSNSFVVMDRNLGATLAPESGSEPAGTELSETYGFYYQWGRKDPFAMPGTSVYKYDSESTSYITETSPFSTTSETVSKTVGTSVSSPMTYHLASSASASGGVFNDNDFFSGFDVTSDDNEAENQCFSNMVHPDDRQSLWGYSATTGYGVTTTKTMYDPCPPGYIVAHYLVWTNTERSSNSAYLYYSNLDGGFKNHGISQNRGSGIFLTNHSELFAPAWFPYSGYIAGDSFSLEKKGDMGVFHTSTPAGNGSRSLMYNSTYSGQAVDGDYMGLPSSMGYPVRCQKE